MKMPIALLSFLLAASVALPQTQPSAPRPSQQTIREWQGRKFGMFIHWGLYSIPGGVWDGKKITNGYSEQIMSHAPVPKEDYEKLAAQFNPVKWDPEAVVKLAKAAGMKFIVITSKHHDGFAMFQTKTTNYNVVDATPYGKDVVKQLSDACARNGIKFGVYYSTIDWHHPDATPWTDDNNNDIPAKHADLNVAQLRELTTHYGPLTELWFDMGKPTPEQSRRFTDTVHSNQPQCMVSGRVFNHQGDFTVMGDNAVPEFIIDEPWQTPASIYDETWGYRSWQDRSDLNGKINEHITEPGESGQPGRQLHPQHRPARRRLGGRVRSRRAAGRRQVAQHQRRSRLRQPAAAVPQARLRLRHRQARAPLPDGREVARRRGAAPSRPADADPQGIPARATPARSRWGSRRPPFE